MSALRWSLLCGLLLASVSFAQTEEAPPPPPPPTPENVAPTPPPPPPVVEATPPATDTTNPADPSLGDRLTKSKRFSRFSAGPGGPLFAFDEFVLGLVGGGFVGAAMGGTSGGVSGIGTGTYVGAVVGGLTLTGLGIALQYMHPFGLGTSAAITLAAGLGALAGLGVADIIKGDAVAWSWSFLLGSQVGLVAAMLATWNAEDINGEDVALTGMGALHVFVVAALAAATAQSAPPAWVMLMAPAVGMGLGAIWAMNVDMSPGRVLKLTLLPVGVGTIFLYLGAVLVGSGQFQLAALGTLAAYLVTFGITYLFTMEPDDVKGPVPVKRAGAPMVMPTVAVMPAGRRNEAVAMGPALLVAF